jgi:hypothetical protein
MILIGELGLELHKSDQKFLKILSFQLVVHLQTAAQQLLHDLVKYMKTRLFNSKSRHTVVY